MLIKFQLDRNKTDEWSLDSVPRVGDTIYIRGGAREVHDVMWVLSDDDGHSIKPYVVIALR